MWQKLAQRLGGAPKCAVCAKVAYPQEQVSYNKQIYHEGCFKCVQCKSQLSVSSVSRIQDQIYCQNCFQRLPASQRALVATKEKDESKEPQTPDKGEQRLAVSSPEPILSPPRHLSGVRSSPPPMTPPNTATRSVGLSIFQDSDQKDLFSCGVCGTDYRFKLTFAPASLNSFLSSSVPASSSTSSLTSAPSSPLPSSTSPKILTPGAQHLSPSQAELAKLLSNFITTLPPTGLDCKEYHDLRIYLNGLGANLPTIESPPSTTGEGIDEKTRVETEDDLQPTAPTRLSSFKEEEEEKDEKETLSALPSLKPASGATDFRRDRRTGLRSTVPRGEASSTSLEPFGSSSEKSDQLSGLSSGSLGGFSARGRTRARSSSTGGGVARKRAPSIVEYAMGRPGTKSEEEDDSTRTARLETVEKFLEAIQVMSAELEPHNAASKIIEETCKLLMCERANLFTLDPDTDELILTVQKGDSSPSQYRLPMSKGVVGLVATKGELINIKDTVSDSRWDEAVDNKDGSETPRNVLAVPICLSDTGEVIAVIQCVNKMLVPAFSPQDEILLQNIAAHSSIVLRNSQLYLQALRAEQKVNSLLELVQMLHSSPNITSLIFTLSARAHQLVNADKCTLYLCDRTRTPAQLVVMQGEVDIRFPLNKGLAGHVATTGEIVNIPDCYKDDRFNKQVDIKTGYHTKSMLCMPIFGDDSEKEVIGVLQFLNKMDEAEFGPADESILAVLLKIAGPIIKNSFFFKGVKHDVGSPTSLITEEHPASARYRVSTGGSSLEPPAGGKSPIRTPRHKEKFSNSLGSFAEGD